MNTSSTSLLRTSITAAPRRRARRPMESVSASIAPYWMSSIASRSARRSTAASTSCRLTSMPGWSSTTICGLIKAAGASARPRCRLFLTHYHWRRRNSWLLDHCRQNTLPQTANTACQIKSELIQFKLSHDPDFVPKLRDIVGLYVDPPAHAIVLSVDEKSQIQALDRTQPGLPLKPG